MRLRRVIDPARGKLSLIWHLKPCALPAAIRLLLVLGGLTIASPVVAGYPAPTTGQNDGTSAPRTCNSLNCEASYGLGIKFAADVLEKSNWIDLEVFYEGIKHRLGKVPGLVSSQEAFESYVEYNRLDLIALESSLCFLSERYPKMEEPETIDNQDGKGLIRLNSFSDIPGTKPAGNRCTDRNWLQVEISDVPDATRQGVYWAKVSPKVVNWQYLKCINSLNRKYSVSDVGPGEGDEVVISYRRFKIDKYADLRTSNHVNTAIDNSNDCEHFKKNRAMVSKPVDFVSGFTIEEEWATVRAPLAGLIEGWQDVLGQIEMGDLVRVVVEPVKAYGAQGAKGVGEDETLLYELYRHPNLALSP